MQCELHIVQIQYIVQSLWQRFVQTDSYTFLNVSLPGRSGVEKREQITGGSRQVVQITKQKDYLRHKQHLQRVFRSLRKKYFAFSSLKYLED